MNTNQRKAIFAHIEEEKRAKAVQLAATGKLEEWEDEDKEGD